jgi:hypothetical protein
VKPPKITATPTLPFSHEQINRIVEACDQYGANHPIKAVRAHDAVHG